jgi:tellurite resistance protein
MSISLDPRIKRFQAIKAACKKAAIERKTQEDKRKEAITNILTTSPQLTEKQANQIYEAHQRHQQVETRVFGKRVVKVFHA